MSTFIQLHLLTAYPPANLNRDDLGRPKTAYFGGKQRLRVSSQSLKRAWRMSPVFQEYLGSSLGTRTRIQGEKVYDALIAGGIDEKKALKWARAIAGQFGELEPDKGDDEKKKTHIRQLAHFSPEELDAIDALVDEVIESGKAPSDDQLELLRADHKAADVAMFGRMLAAAPRYNTDAAVQVAHAITVNPVEVEDDYFSAVDDLNEGLEDVGAGHIGEIEFGSGVFYLYICINRSLLLDNLQGDEALTSRAIRALTQSACTVAPTGKQNTFASRAYASYALAERGSRQPRSLAVAFLDPIERPKEGMLKEAIGRLEGWQKRVETAYGASVDEITSLNVLSGEGNLDDLLEFVGQS